MDVKDYLKLMKEDVLDGYEADIKLKLFRILMMGAELEPESAIREAEQDFFDAIWDWIEDDAEHYVRYLDQDREYEDREDKRQMRLEHERDRAKAINDVT